MKKFLKQILVLGTALTALTMGAAAAELEGLQYYDDHLDVSGKTVEILDAGTPTSYQVGYGVEENTVPDTAVLTLADDQLIATGTGSAAVRIDGTEYDVEITAAPVSLLLLIGQSNMQGIDGSAGESIVCPAGQVYATYADRYQKTVEDVTKFAPGALAGAYSTVNVTGDTACLESYPVNMLTDAGNGREGMDSGIAYEWAKQTGEKVWTVNVGYGGSSITQWQQGGIHYQACLELLAACQETLHKEIDAGHFTLSHMAYFWCQGCADESQTAEWYVDQFLTMHETLKTDMAYDEHTTFEFAGIVPIRSGHHWVSSYRTGAYKDSTNVPYYQSYQDLQFNGPRVAQYWMGNHPELKDIWNVCTIQEGWATLPDGTDGVADYFEAAYENGIVDYSTQVKQTASWYQPTTPAAVHDNIHYNQIGYNELGREAARNALILLGELDAPDAAPTVEFLTWDGFTPADQIAASTTGDSGTLVVPMVSPVWKSKDVTYTVSDGLRYEYYDLLAESVRTEGTLTAVDAAGTITVAPRDLSSFRWHLDGSGLTNEIGGSWSENSIAKLAGSVTDAVFSGVRYQADRAVQLLHDEDWCVEIQIENWTAASGSMILSSSPGAVKGAPYFYFRPSDFFVGIGCYNGSTYDNYGISLKQHGIACADGGHTYRFLNRVSDDGTNMIYLLVDDEMIGPLTDHYINSTLADSGNNWLSGRDFAMSYLGTTMAPISNCTIHYIAVTETNYDPEMHLHDWSDWELMTAPSCDGPGEEKRTCSGCGEAQTRKVEGVWQTHDLGTYLLELPEAVCCGLNLWEVLPHTQLYYHSGTHWATNGDVWAVTIPVEPGDRLYATSWGKAGENGSATSNGIRCTFFDAYGIAKTLSPAETYAEFAANGCLTAPEGSIAVNVPMWNGSDANELYILSADHEYDGAVCTICGERESIGSAYFGKTVSVLGDSISTMSGVSNSTAANSTIGKNAVYYSGSSAGVTRADTWWQQTIDALDMELLVNNSWSGSCILHTRSNTVGAYVDRCVQLHNDTTGEEPDIILVFMGTNDFSYYQSALGSSDIDYDALIVDHGDGTYSYGEPTTSCEAYAIMMHKMKNRYPEAEIFCMTMMPRREPVYSGSNVGQPTEFNGELEKIIEKFGASVIDLENCGITKTPASFDPYMHDKRVHPSAEGMDLMTQAVVSALLEKETAVYDVEVHLEGVMSDNAARVCLESYETALAAINPASVMEVTVTMGGEDITDGCCSDGVISIPNVTGDIVITASAQRGSMNFRWEYDDGELVSAGADGIVENDLTKIKGTTENGVFADTYYKTACAVELLHDKEWTVEWRGEGSGGFMLGEASGAAGAPFFFRRAGTYLHAFGAYDGSRYNNYGLALNTTDIDGKAQHIYQLENRIAEDGSNMVHLYVDGAEVGALNNYCIGGSPQGTTGNWISGKDFYINYIGTSSHPIDNYVLDYLQVWEEGDDRTSQPFEYSGKVISILGDSISTFAGYIPVADGFNLTHLARYPQDNLLTDVNETWWMQVIDELDGKLGINDSWRGSTVSGYPAVTTGVTGYLAAMSNLTQLQNLGSNGTPDVILFYGGTNDLAHTPNLGSFDPASAPEQVDLTTLKWNNLADAYANILLRLQYFYPDTQIVAMLPTYTASYYSNSKLAQGNALMAAICEHYGVTYVDLRNCGITTADLPDGIHPDAKGMDHITDAVLKTLFAECEMEAGENVVYSVQHDLDGGKASCGHFKGISAGMPFEEALSGENLIVTVTMGGEDITAECYEAGKISIPAVTGDLVITAKAKFTLGDHLQQLPEKICCGYDLWPALKHEGVYSGASGWTSMTGVTSVTIPVSAGDTLWATSFGPVGENGNSVYDGIRVTFFGENGVLRSLTHSEVYALFTENGYLTVPDGATAVNIPMWCDDSELYILSRPHDYETTAVDPTCTEQGYAAHICTVCEDTYAEDYTDELGHYHETAAVLADGEQLVLTELNVIKTNKCLLFSADVSDLGDGVIRMGHGQKAYSGNHLEITADKLRVYSTYKSVTVTEYSHGLTIDGRVHVRAAVERSGIQITITTQSGTFSKRVGWDGSNGEIFCQAVGTTLTNVDLRWYGKGIEEDVWLFGDSWFSATSTARWTKYLLDDGYTNVLLGAYGGMGVSAGLKQFREIVEIHVPAYAVWALGMNNGDWNNKLNSGWLTATEEFLALCEEHGVTPILATIPHTPRVNNLYKNEWIRNSGYRYIDFDLAVVENHTSGEWFAGMAASDLAHPTTLGAQALYPQAFADFPELAAGSKEDCSHKLYALDAREPECEFGGREAYYVCSLCGGVYQDADGQTETTTEAMLLKPLGHSGDESTAVVTAPTCTEPGYTTYTCHCGESYTADDTAPTGHAYDSDRDTDCNRCGEKRKVAVRLSGSVKSRRAGAKVTLESVGEATVQSGSYAFDSVEQGSYTLTVKQDGCLTYTVQNITVDGIHDVALPEIQLVAGDVNGDDLVNARDIAVFRRDFGKWVENTSNPLTDIDGNGMVNAMDITALRRGFGKSAAKDCTITF